MKNVINTNTMYMEKLIVDESKINYKVERRVKVRDILIDVPLKYRCSAINAVFPISSKEERN
ncbi:MAG: hypothetical protein US74_C0023G0016 [Parcubacteria group bacterium GW2011_GWA2_38_13]|nr:MAG: hypothetical protein US74_C0023G0016 [Parcubacteria group bacterium GW2011_GWA2_38_13]